MASRRPKKPRSVCVTRAKQFPIRLHSNAKPGKSSPTHSIRGMNGLPQPSLTIATAPSATPLNTSPQRVAAEDLAWRRKWQSGWMPRYVGVVWPAVAIAVSCLLLRLPTRGPAAGAIAFVLAAQRHASLGPLVGWQ